MNINSLNIDGRRKFWLFIIVFAVMTAQNYAKVITPELYCDVVKSCFYAALIGYGAEYTRDVLRSRFESRRNFSIPSAAKTQTQSQETASAGGAEGAEK